MGAAVGLIGIPESIKGSLLTYLPKNTEKELGRPMYLYPAVKAMRLTNLVFNQAPKDLIMEPKQEEEA